MNMPLQQVIEKITQLQDHMDKRFEQVDKRFDEVDNRFEQVDKRFDEVYGRFDEVYGCFDEQKKVNVGFALEFLKIDKRFERLEEQMQKNHNEVLNGFDKITHILERHELELCRSTKELSAWTAK